jgi:hypothetical protein
VVKEFVETLYTYAGIFLKGKFIGGDGLCIADFAMAPMIFVLGHEVVKAKTGLVLPERWQKWLADFMAEVPASKIFSSCDGASVGEVLASKAGGDPVPVVEVAPPAAQDLPEVLVR